MPVFPNSGDHPSVLVCVANGTIDRFIRLEDLDLVSGMLARHDGKPSHTQQVETILKSVGRYGTRQRSNLRRGKSHDRKLLVRVSLVFMLISIGIVLTMVFLYFRAGSATRLATGGRAFDPGLETKAENMELEPLDPEAAIRFVRAALGNRDPALVSSHFILGASAATPREVIALLDEVQSREGSPDGIEYLGSKMASEYIVEEVVVTSVKDGRVSNRVAQLRPDGGEWRIDLDSYARHASPGWEDILARKCETATVRVFISPDNYYNGEPFSEDLWKCHGLISPDVDEIMFGYASRGSAQEKALERILSKEEPFHRAMISIRVSEKQGRMQFEISRVIADDWFIGETSFDVSF